MEPITPVLNYKVPIKQLLNFVANEDLYKQVSRVLDIAGRKNKRPLNIYRNSLDPFSAVFDGLRQGLNMEAWIVQETMRQTQKTLQNAIGTFHQEILGSVKGWESLGIGHVVDLKNIEKKIIAEVKNKHNTTKGNHRTSIYDDLEAQLSTIFKGYTGYYVEIIPKKKGVYNDCYTPSDNKTHERRPQNEKIRVIDGKSFYHLVTGEENALKNLYEILPRVIGDIIGNSANGIGSNKAFEELFSKLY